MTKRAVITGIGAVTPLGNNASDFWQNIKAGKNGISRITHFDPSDQKCVMGGEVKNYQHPDKREAKRMDLFSQYGATAAREALADSGLKAGENIDPNRFGVIAGSGIGGITTIEKEVSKAQTNGLRRVSALMVPMVIGNILAGHISILSGAKGESLGVITACSTGTNAIGEAFRQIKHGYADSVIAGASEASFAPVSFAAFANMTAMSTRTDPDRCSTPFDLERDGFVMGEGAGILIVEELEHAKARGAKIYGEVIGYGSTSDAYHVTMPDPSGEAPARAMSMAISEAGISPADISYINAHGTSTPYNDSTETNAIKAVFGKDAYHIPVSSTKSMTGHALGAAGAMEAIICLRAMQEGIVPPTINLRVPDPQLDLDYVPDQARKKELQYTLSNSFGFGGHNGCLVFAKWKE